MPTPQKAEIVTEIAEEIKNSQAIIFTDYRGLTVAQISSLRAKLRESDTRYAVVKNTLFKLAAEDLIPADPKLDETLNGPTALGFAHKDAVETAKAFQAYIDENRNTPLKLKGLLIGNKFYDASGVERLTKAPSREESVARILGSLQSPIANFVGTLDNINPGVRLTRSLQNVLGNLVNTLQNIQTQKEQAGA